MVKEFTRQINANAQESYVSLILGFLVVVVSGVLLYNFITKKTASESTVNLPAPTITEEVISTVSGTLTLTRQQPTTVPSVTPSRAVQPTATAVPTVPPTATPTPIAMVSPSPAAAAQSGSTHTVKKGETLWTLSERYYGTGFEWRKIAEANRLPNPRIIDVGQKLMIPQGVQKGPSISATSTELPKSYMVVAGDSLWKIAQAYYGTGFEWVNIARENKLTTPDLIYPGTVLQLFRRSTTLDPPGGASNPLTKEKK